MNPQPLFCLNLHCPSRGLLNAGNIGVHNSLENRFRCHTCGATFASNKGTLFYRLKTDPKSVILVLTLLAYGCPLTAIVAAFALDRRTVENWQKKAGEHCKQVHDHLVTHQPRDLGQVVKRYEKKRVIGVDHRLLQGTWQAFTALNVAGQTMNTAYIERLNATFRQHLCGLVRRGRCLLRKEAVLERGMYLVGCVYNFCTPHQSLRLRQAPGAAWVERTPAMAAGITEDIWSVSDLLFYRIAPAPYVAPKPKSKRGRPLGSKNKPKSAVEATK